MELKKIVFGSKDIPFIVRTELLSRIKEYKVFAFQGPLGAGKTTIIKNFFLQCGIESVVTSPTFTYVKQYEAPDGSIFYHFDLYRLNSLDSFLQLGFDEYLFEKGSVSVIEWPEIIHDLLRKEEDKVLFIKLNYIKDNMEHRELTICGNADDSYSQKKN